MTTTLSRHTRWAVPGVAAVVVVAGFAVGPMLASASTASLPDISADQLVKDVLAAKPQPLSGTVVYTANLGLPDVSELSQAINGPVVPVNPQDLLAGTSTLRVWTDAASRSRVTLQGTTSEFSVVHDQTQAWTYSSTTQEVVHYALSKADQARVAQGGEPTATPGVPGDLPTPAAVANDVLSTAKESSTLALDAPVTIAGRAAYQLVITPKSTTTLVGKIVVAVDGKTSTPLKVTVWSRSDTKAPSLEVGFTDVTFATPSNQVLTWSTPAGATVKDVTVPLPSDNEKANAKKDAPSSSVTGTGWDSVLTLTGVPTDALTAQDVTDLATSGGIGPDKAKDYGEITKDQGVNVNPSALLDQLSTPVAGGRVISSSLLSVLLMDDGRVLVGAVPPATLIGMAG